MSLRSQILVNKQALPTAEQALPGRSTAMPVPPAHHVNGNPLQPPFPAGLQQAVFGMGCFWGAERRFWEQPGVWTTAVGYAGGITPNPTYDEVCSGLTGHTEAVLVVFDPQQTSFEALLKVFWEAHNPTQGMRQGNDQGTQYRSAIYCQDATQLSAALASQARFQNALDKAGLQLSDLSFVETHDCFTVAELIEYEAMGLTPKGQGARAIKEGWTQKDGKLPVNPSGGLKAKGHPIGATGVSMHVMSAMQLAGQAPEGMQLKNPQIGGIFNMGGAAVANYVSILEPAK